jgi:Meiotically up-regulated gene 113
MQFVYFAGCGDLVKIGITRTVYQRIKTLNTASPSPITLLAHMVGGEREETVLLRLAKREGLHVRGEWFRREGKLADLITAIAKLDDPLAARGIADQWWMDAVGIRPGREALPNNQWQRYAGAAGVL